MPYADPAARAAYSKAYRENNRERISAGQKKWYERNRDGQLAKFRENNLRRRYGITGADYERILAAQGGRCAICRTDKSLGRGRFHVDHDHKTGRVRGILCHRCNTTLGWIESYMQDWSVYMARHYTRAAVGVA